MTFMIFFHRLSQCLDCRDLLSQWGVASEVVTARSDREQQIEDFNTGKLQVLLSMAILAEGFDCRSLRTVFCRPSGKACTVQMGGRVFRKHPTQSSRIMRGSEQGAREVAVVRRRYGRLSDRMMPWGRRWYRIRGFLHRRRALLRILFWSALTALFKQDWSKSRPWGRFFTQHRLNLHPWYGVLARTIPTSKNYGFELDTPCRSADSCSPFAANWWKGDTVDTSGVEAGATTD